MRKKCKETSNDNKNLKKQVNKLVDRNAKLEKHIPQLKKDI